IYGNDPRSADIWQALFDYNADVVLVGHEHSYERFAPQDPSENANLVNGIRQFIIGTGGASMRQYGVLKPNSEIHTADSFGVAKFELSEGKYKWEFLPAEGSTFTDKGEANCVM
ncbi:MAG: alkaline phosphatase, partial [Burkholderiales bacterium]